MSEMDSIAQDGVDVSVIVTAHAETVIAGPSMHSAEAAIAKAEADGLRVERIIALDQPTEGCRTFFEQPAFAEWTCIVETARDPGETRNSAVEKSHGAFVTCLAAGDLMGENWIVAALSAGRTQSDKAAIVHPEVSITFDGEASVEASLTPADSGFVPEYFYFRDYYAPLCFAPRAAHEAIPYLSAAHGGGARFPDRHFAIETLNAGWTHVMARDTVLFRRRRTNTPETTADIRWGTAPFPDALAIDSVRGLGQTR